MTTHTESLATSLPDAVFHAEFQMWQTKSLGIAAAAAAAAHGAARYLAMIGADWGAAPPWLVQLAKKPNKTTVQAALQALGLPDSTAGLEAWTQLRQVAAPTPVLLLDDGDLRSALSPETGLNKYGCAPLPWPGTVALSACSGNELGPVGLAAAEDLRLRLMQAAAKGHLSSEIEIVACSQQSTMTTLLNLHLRPGDGVMQTRSGTEAIEVAARHFCQGPQPCLYLIVGLQETGSEVPKAVAVGPHVTVEGIEIRDAETGEARSADELVTQLVQRIEAALGRKMRVVLQVVEGSKTGLVAPGLSGVRHLVDRFPVGLQIVADCCQMRPGTQAADYWDLGAAVVATGSKFLGGPVFSGIAFIPGGGSLPVPSVGTLLRWQAALAESDGYGHLSAMECAAGLQVFTNFFAAKCQDYPGFFPLRDRYPAHVMTLLVADHDDRLLSMAELRQIYRYLRQDLTAHLPSDANQVDAHLAGLRCLSGQPVALGDRAGLRLALNAGRLVRLVQDPKGISNLAADLGLLLGKIDLIQRLYLIDQDAN